MELHRFIMMQYDTTLNPSQLMPSDSVTHVTSFVLESILPHDVESIPSRVSKTFTARPLSYVLSLTRERHPEISWWTV